MESLGSILPHPALSEAFGQLSQHHAAKLLLRVRSGSHAFGLAHAQSDEDERGVFVIPSAEYGGLKTLPSQISDAKSDHVYYSLRRMFELLSDSNPGMLELLFTPEDCVIARAPRLAELFAQRSIFVSQQLVLALLGYASGQIKKGPRSKQVDQSASARKRTGAAAVLPLDSRAHNLSRGLAGSSQTAECLAGAIDPLPRRSC